MKYLLNYSSTSSIDETKQHDCPGVISVDDKVSFVHFGRDKKYVLSVSGDDTLLAEESQPYNQIWYTSVSGTTVSPYSGSFGDLDIVSNVYENGKGIITFSDDLTSIGDGAFTRYPNNLATVSLPDSITSLDVKVFRGCKFLSSVVLPKRLTSIGNYAFQNCESLSEITIPSTVTSMGASTFSGCYFTSTGIINNSSCTSDDYWKATIVDSENSDGILINGTAVVKCRKSATSVLIPSGITSISNYAFQDCSNLISVSGGSSLKIIGVSALEGCTQLTNFPLGQVTTIGSYAFESCTSLTSASIPYTTTSIGEYAYSGCSSLSSISISSAGSALTIGNGAFRGCTSLTSISLPSYTSSIGGAAFQGCTSLSSVTLPSQISYVPASAFNGCTSLPVIDGIRYADTLLVEVTDKTITSASIANGTRWMGDNTFKGCTSLATVSLPATLEIIGAASFYGTAISEITIPASVQTVHGGSFNNCSNLSKVYFVSTVPPTLEEYGVFVDLDYYQHVFSGNAADLTLYVPNKAVNTYKTDPAALMKGWGSYTAIIAGYGVGNDEVWYTTEGGIVLTPDTTSGGFGANIVSNTYSARGGIIKFDGNVTTIPQRAFAISSYTEGTTGNLLSISLPETLTSIGQEAFENCGGLTVVSIPDSVTSIGNNAFNGCTGLPMTSGYYCRSTSTDVSDNICCIGPYVGFQDVTITIESGTKFIQGGAFSGCTWISGVVIPSSVSFIGDEAFKDCTGLEEIHCQSTTPPTCGSLVFNNNYTISGTNHRYIFVPSSAVDSYKAASGWSTYSSYILAEGQVPTNQVWYTTTDGRSVTPGRMSGSGSPGFGSTVTVYDSRYRGDHGVVYLSTTPNFIGYYTFSKYADQIGNGWASQNSDYLTSLTPPEGITKFSNGCLFYDTNLTTLTIPSTVTSISSTAFDYSGITTIYCYATNPPSYSGNIFSSNTVTVYVPSGSVSTYGSATGWSRAAQILALP